MRAFETVSFHIVKPCNMKCKFCYATFEDMHVGTQMSLEDASKIVNKLSLAGVQKITFAGGEPMLYRHIKEIIRYAKLLGLTTSIITNGSLLTPDLLSEMAPHLDWIGVSIDSLDPEIQRQIGRVSHNPINYYDLIDNIKMRGYRLKINTVVNRYNRNENMNNFIQWANPDRWKVFQTLPVKGQNDLQFEEIKCTDVDFKRFIQDHRHQQSIVPENNEAMTGSYLLVDPLGRLFENSNGEHTYSDSLINYSANHCLSQINLNRERFEKRGGIYDWKQPPSISYEAAAALHPESTNESQKL